MFHHFLYMPESEGGQMTLIENIKEYIKQTAEKFPLAFASQKNATDEDKNILNITLAFQTLASGMDNYYEDLFKNNPIHKKGDKYFDPEYYHHMFDFHKPQDVLLCDIATLDVIYHKFTKGPYYLDESRFSQARDIVMKVQQSDSINKVFGVADWYNMPFEKVMFTLYDYHKKKGQILHVDSSDCNFEYVLDYQASPFFEKILKNCKSNDELNFDKYRTSLISNKKTYPNLDKLIFCKNFLSFCKTGKMPNCDGYMYFDADAYTQDTIKDDLKKVYNKKFSLDKFKKLQANYIFRLENIKKPTILEGAKSTLIDNMFAMGVLLSAENKDNSNKVFYLIHVFMKDIHNDTGVYEIQLNILPQGDIKNRIQLMRMDNWETPQPHKNLGNKLTTSTHIHLYNEFDILRGKENGGFDIAFNIENSNTNFFQSLDNFLSMLDLDYDLQDLIYTKIQFDKNKRLEKLQSEKTDEI